MHKNKQQAKPQYVPSIDSIRKGKYARIARYTSEILNKDFEDKDFDSEKELIDYIRRNSFKKDKDDVVYLLNKNNSLIPIKDAIILTFDSYHLIDYLEYLSQEAEKLLDTGKISLSEFNNHAPKYNYYGLIKEQIIDFNSKPKTIIHTLKFQNPDPRFDPNIKEYQIANTKYNYNILTSILSSTSDKKHRDVGRVFEDNKEMMMKHMLEN
jgi:hypothetical protein